MSGAESTRPARRGPLAGTLRTVDGASTQVLTGPDADQTIRWRAGERLHHLFEQRCDQLRASGQADQLAVHSRTDTLTYPELDRRANQLARHLRSIGVSPGQRVALLFDEPVRCYVAMLAVLKIHAAYVPLDVGFPADRLGYIVRDADVSVLLSQSHLAHLTEDLAADRVFLDQVAAEIQVWDTARLDDEDVPPPVDDLCYVIYTSGSTGRPKGVPIEHASVCNFVRVAVEMYGLEPSDRVYQGMTIAFDFSVEEIWVPLITGATLVPKPDGSSLVGYELAEFIQDRAITALCCVPTLLATIDKPVSSLRFLLVSGEACPADLIVRWHQPGRRFLNVYGPTETTVSATLSVVDPDRPVTIGAPLPTYSVVILDPERAKALPPGELGEIGVAGIGLAPGYLGRADLTARVFIPDFLGIENNPSGRIYRTGDLGRITSDGEIEYHGRIDTQVKIRGYRIELAEIEAVLLSVPGIGQAVVDSHEPEPGQAELVAYYCLRDTSAPVSREAIYQELRASLPSYMVPAFLEQLDMIPMTPSDKADRKNLPPPRGQRSLVGQEEIVEPEGDVERGLAEALASVLRVERVSVESDLFAELAVNSLLVAKFCAAVRERAELPAPSLKDVYQHPTLRRLAAALTDQTTTASEQCATSPTLPVFQPKRGSHIACGAFQLLVYLGYLLLSAAALDQGISWIFQASGPVGVYVRSVIAASGVLLTLGLVPVIAKWVLIGRWKPREFPVWGPAYLRFWTVRVLTRFSPLVLLVGSPLYVLYLRSLGARIGPGVTILSRITPVCTDLLTIGAGSVIRKDTSFTCYRAEGGRIRTGPITLGVGAYVGEGTTLDIETEIGDAAQLGHASCLHLGQSVPAGQRWHGSPAVPTEVDYVGAGPRRCGRVRRALFSGVQLMRLFLVTAPLLVLGGTLLANLIGTNGSETTTGAELYEDAAGAAFTLEMGAILVGLLLVVTLPRLISPLLKSGRDYPLYGIHYTAYRAVVRMTNITAFTRLFGDSSLIIGYLSRLGYGLRPVEQTGSNFGLTVKQDTPFLTRVGTGTLTSDGLSIVNAEFSATSFRLAPTTIGARNFLGNNIVYPPGGRTGENCLLATKVMVPLDGPIREHTGLLGSPPFEIPRSVKRDQDFNHMRTGDALRRHLAAKLRHNSMTILWYLLAQLTRLYGIFLIASFAGAMRNTIGFPVWTLAMLAIIAFSVSHSILVERAAQGFRALRPRFCSIYDPAYWRHERFWKLSIGAYLGVFSGTPFKSIIVRMLGVRMGRMVFDDGCYIPERSLVTVGDYCTLGAGTVVQGHSLEDGAFKSDRIVVGSGCTLGASAFVHYGVTIEDEAVIDPDAFLMKGGYVTRASRWRGNPAVELTRK